MHHDALRLARQHLVEACDLLGDVSLGRVGADGAGPSAGAACLNISLTGNQCATPETMTFMA